MRLLDRYLLRELMIPLVYCLSGFLIFWISFDLFSELEEFQTLKMRGGDVLEFYILKLPELLVLVLPVALLLALLYSLTNHTRHHEFTAIRAAGVSLWRLCLPYVMMGGIFTGMVFCINEYWVPSANEKVEMLKLRRISALGGQVGKGSKGTKEVWKANLRFQNSRDQRFWAIGSYNMATSEMRNPALEWKEADGSRRQVVAQSAVWTNSAWVFLKVKEYFYGNRADDVATVEEKDSLTLRGLTETPELIRSEVRISSLTSIRAAKGAQLSIEELVNYFALHPQLDGKQYALLHTQFQGRMATPFMCLVVVLVAIPFGTMSGRRNMVVGVASSIFICFGYFVLQRLGLALGTGGYVPPWIAAWLPNVAFALLGTIMTSLMR